MDSLEAPRTRRARGASERTHDLRRAAAFLMFDAACRAQACGACSGTPTSKSTTVYAHLMDDAPGSRSSSLVSRSGAAGTRESA